MKIKLPNKNILLYSALLAAVLLCCLLQIIALRKTKVFLQNAEGSDIAVSASASPLSGDTLFLLRECGGKIGIFDAKSNILVDVIDVFAASLPVADQKALRQGVEVRSFAELASMIEDLST